jgi:uncharacterized circularly permuted ATP-grasp superfamily protein
MAPLWAAARGTSTLRVLSRAFDWSRLLTLCNDCGQTAPGKRPPRAAASATRTVYPLSIDWKRYDAEGVHDELIGPRGGPRKVAGPLCRMLAALDDDELKARREAASAAIRNMGITFTVYSADSPGGIDREWPFDIIPRTIPASEWKGVEAGLKQRVQALNLFIDDLYNDQHILRDGTVDRDIIANSKDFREQCMGMRPPQGVWAHVCGSDLVRHSDGKLYVLEDNLRVPSGVAYMIENREVIKRTFPELFEDYLIRPVADYPSRLHETLASLWPHDEDVTVAVITPGIYNSAYFEHSFLAQDMGAHLVEGSDLVVDDNDCVHVRTIGGLERVHVIYRRIDDLFLDPEVFREDSMLGAPASCVPGERVRWPSPTRRAAASPMTSWCTPGPTPSSVTTWIRIRCCRSCPRSAAM